MFYRLPRSTYDAALADATDEVGNPPVQMAIDRWDAALLRLTSSWAWLMSAAPDNQKLEDAGAEHVADTWADFWRYLSSVSSGTRDRIFRVAVEEKDPETGRMVRSRMSIHRAENGRGFGRKQKVYSGADIYRGDIDPPAVPDVAREGIVSTPLVPLQSNHMDLHDEQAALDGEAGA